jgi:hypothetical protein
VYTSRIIGQKESLMSVKCSVFVAASLDGYIARLIGEGIPLFGKLDRDVKLLHIETILYRNSLLQTKYQVENAV